MPTSPSLTRLLDLRGRSARSGTFTYELLDPDLEREGWLTPLEPPRIDNDADRPIHRTMTGLRLDASEWDEIDLYRHRVRVRYDPDGGHAMPLGVFVFGPTDRARRHRRGSVAVARLSDQGVILDQQFGRAESIYNLDNASEWLEDQLDRSGIARRHLDAEFDQMFLLGNMTWGPRAIRLVAYNLVGAAFGALPIFFDNHGTLRMIRPSELDRAPIRYPLEGPSARIYVDSATESVDPTRAPNVFVILDTDREGRNFSMRRRVPRHSPHSVERRGYQVIRTVEVQGLWSRAQARRMMRALQERTRATHETVFFEGPIDPRHDTYNRVVYGNDVLREARWSMECREGGAMRHELRRHFLDVDVDLPDPIEWEIPFPDSGGIVFEDEPDEQVEPPNLLTLPEEAP